MRGSASENTLSQADKELMVKQREYGPRRTALQPGDEQRADRGERVQRIDRLVLLILCICTCARVHLPLGFQEPVKHLVRTGICLSCARTGYYMIRANIGRYLWTPRRRGCPVVSKQFIAVCQQLTALRPPLSIASVALQDSQVAQYR